MDARQGARHKDTFQARAVRKSIGGNVIQGPAVRHSNGIGIQERIRHVPRYLYQGQNVIVEPVHIQILRLFRRLQTDHGPDTVLGSQQSRFQFCIHHLVGRIGPGIPVHPFHLDCVPHINIRRAAVHSGGTGKAVSPRTYIGILGPGLNRDPQVFHFFL